MDQDRKRCPLRQGKPCVGDECAWFHEWDDMCGVLSIATTVAEIVVELQSRNNPTQIIPHIVPAPGIDDDIPF